MGIALLLAAMPGMQTSGAQQPDEPEHRRGPKGLEGWILTGTVSDDPQEYPFTLVIARNGKVVRQIDGRPLVWNWIFLPDGKRVAYEAGPKHFGLTCILADIRTGRELASYDCFHGIPDNAPEWLKMLEGSQ